MRERLNTSTLQIESSDISPPKSLIWPGIGRRETVCLAITASALLMAYNWLAYIWLDMIDEGYFLEQAMRILRGAMPYRDFDTYYTPAAIYLHALTFSLTGEQSVIPVRLILAVVRTLTAVFLYLLARPLAPPPIAAIPVALVLLVDPVPVMWEPHPGTYANLAMLIVLWSTAVFLEQRRLWGLVVAGIAAGVAFAFKQNIGVFAILAVGGFLALHERPRLPGWLVATGRLAVALGMALLFTFLIKTNLSGLYIIIFLLPLYAICAFVFWDVSRRETPSMPWRDVLKIGAAFGIPFLVVSLAWLVPLTVALGPGGVPWNLFIGRVNKAALFYSLLNPSPAFPYLVALAASPLVGFALLRPYGRRTIAYLSGFVLAVAIGFSVPILAPDPFRPDILNVFAVEVLNALNVTVGNVLLYLPSILFWPALVLVIALSLRRDAAPVSRWRWYLFAGAIMMFAQYPRVDEIHLLHASPAILVAGAGLAATAWRAAPRWSLAKLAVLLATIGLPFISVSSSAAWRAVAYVVPDGAHPDRAEYAQLDLPRAPVVLPANVVRSVRGLVEYVVERTSPGEPIFVFPVSPMFYFLADRPNPTRYNHLQPGVADEAEQFNIIQDLSATRFVIWDHQGVFDWETTPAYKRLSDYIWWCFTPMEDFPPYVVMQRSERCPE